MLGLLAAIIARVLRIPTETDSGNAWDKAVPVPWSQSPLPFTEMSWRPRWAIPLAEFSLLLSLGGVLLVFSRWNLAETPAALVMLLEHRESACWRLCSIARRC